MQLIRTTHQQQQQYIPLTAILLLLSLHLPSTQLYHSRIVSRSPLPARSFVHRSITTQLDRNCIVRLFCCTPKQHSHNANSILPLPPSSPSSVPPSAASSSVPALSSFVSLLVHPVIRPQSNYFQRRRNSQWSASHATEVIDDEQDPDFDVRLEHSRARLHEQWTRAANKRLSTDLNSNRA